MIEYLELPIGTGGVLSCAKCGPTGPEVRPYAAEEVLPAIVAAFQMSENAAPVPNLVFGGFEPFRHPALPTLISAAVEAGAQRIMLRTDAGALATPGNAVGCVSVGVRALEVVLLADGERHDAVCGRPGLAATAEAGIAIFRQAAKDAGAEVAVFGALPLCRHNVADLPSAVAAFARLGAVAVRIEAKGLKVTPEHSGALDAAVHTGAVNRVAVSVVGWSGDLPALADSTPYTVQGHRV